VRLGEYTVWRVRNTIVAGNLSGGDCVMGFGSFIPPGFGYNLSSDTTCPFDSTSLTNVSNPLLDALLLNNGGPTDTHALLPLSPAIDYVPVSVCVDVAGNPVATDQRGAGRPGGTACDIGAYEVVDYDVAPTCACAPSGMVGWWPMDEVSGDTMVTDIAGSFNDAGTPKPSGLVGYTTNNPGPQPAVGVVGGALWFFNGTHVEVAAPSTDLDVGTGDFSIDAWIRVTAHQPIFAIVDKFDASSGTGFAFGLFFGSLYLDINGTQFYSAPSGFFPGQNWTHVAVTIKRNALAGGTFYIDGAPLGTTFAPPSGSVTNTLSLLIAKSRQYGSFGDYQIDELEIFNRALSASDIQRIYNAGSAGKCRVSGSRVIGALGPSKVFVGLRNSDDVGLRLDLKAEVLAGSTVIGAGQLNNVPAGGSGFNNAALQSVPLSLINGPVTVPDGTELQIAVSARRTCFGGGHSSGTPRLWFNGASADTGAKRDAGSRFGATIGGLITNYFLRSGSSLSAAAGTSRLFLDKVVKSNEACPNRTFTPFETWRITLP
jgi:hypothetical protein